MGILEDWNIKLSSVVISTSGTTATTLIDMLCEGSKLTLEDTECVYHKATPQESPKACSGFVEEHHILSTPDDTQRHISNSEIGGRPCGRNRIGLSNFSSKKHFSFLGRRFSKQQ